MQRLQWAVRGGLKMRQDSQNFRRRRAEWEVVAGQRTNVGGSSPAHAGMVERDPRAGEVVVKTILITSVFEHHGLHPSSKIGFRRGVG